MSNRFSHAIVLVLVLSLASGAWANLVGHWKLDEGSGTTARDASGNGYDGTLQGGPQWVAGMVGGALRFSGSNSVNCGSAPKAALTQTVSIALWVNPADLTGDRAFASRSAGGIGYAFKSNSTHLRFTTPTILDYDGNNSILKLNTWQHVAVTVTANKTGGCVFYINGVATDTLNSTQIPAGSANVEIGHNHWEQWCMGMIDDVRIYDHILTAKEVQDAMRGVGREVASDPVPADKATDVPRDSVLSWTAGPFAGAHDVYLGTTFTDVNTASRTDAKGVLAGKGQADATFDPPGSLAYGQTYYWRIDEVNKTADATIFKGGVWSFTVEPYGYPVKPAKATASSFQVGMGPEKTIDGSGLTGDLHGTDSTTMWMSAGAQPNWIQYEFDKVYKLNDLKVWNSNQLIEGFLGFGAKSVKIETSTDGTTWTALANVPEFAKAPGMPAYAANTTVNFGGIEAKFVKLTISANWGGMAPQTGLAEVRFTYIPVQAFGPQPATAATGVSVDTALNWRPGRMASSHQVYIGTDPNAVAKGTVAAKTATDHSYTPDPLNLGTAYYWKVDEVNTVTYPGEVWSFTTAAYGVVDDFESYTDKAGQEVFSTWPDGFDNPAKNGAVVGLATSANGTYCDTTIFHGGKASMPIAYDNTKAPLSEATRTFATAQDWTASGVKSLSLWFRGAAGNTGNLYLKINSTKVAYDGAANDVAQSMWLPWNVDLSKVGVDLKKVTSLTIGIEGAGSKGTLNIDDIRLYPRTPAFLTPVQPAATGLVARYTFDGDFRDSAGSYHGTAAGARTVTDTARGQVALFNGTSDKVDVAYNANLNPAAFTVSAWANPTTVGTSYRSPVTSRDDAPQRGYILYIEPTGSTWQFWTGTGTGWNNTASGIRASLGEWTHVAGTFVNNQKVLYLNGRQVGQGTSALGPNTARPLRIGAGASESATGNYFFNGLMDEVCLYNRALPAEEIAGLAGHKQPLQKPF